VDDWFFGVEPTKCDPAALLLALRGVADAAIAVLPELCLTQPAADAIGDALASDPGAYPPLVVAGSVHVRDSDEGGDEIRANESRLYLDGEVVAAHRKIHPFVTRDLNGERLPEPIREGLTDEQKTITVLSGTCTRLTVVICADLNDAQVPSLLEAVGVNLLLVPALTPEPGAFHGTLCALASRCQGVVVIANAHLDPLDAENPPPFLLMLGVPRPDASEQARAYPDEPRQPPSLARFDPNEPLASAVRWLDWH
jgi:predicted amidohydrolase